MKNTNKSKKLWQLINRLIGKENNKKHIIESIKVNEKLLDDPISITSELCDFFANVGEKYASKIPSNPYKTQEYINKIETNSTSLFLAPTSSQEIKNLIQLLTNKTSSGCDNISNNLLKQLTPSILEPLEIIFNKSLQEGLFPETWNWKM